MKIIKKFNKNIHAEHFNFALIVIFLSIFITLFAFISEENKITGFATGTTFENSNYGTIAQSNLREFNDVKSLGSLAAGNYYIDSDGIVYWTDDESNPAIAKVKFVDEIQKNRKIYIDNNGNIGYLLS